jgi:DNA polymerase I-like protein with 3'-5' exonuclease and polymerase domains
MSVDWAGLEAATVVAVDTETSGLHPDDGARTACVACAWRDGDDIHSLAIPFDQGVLTGKVGITEKQALLLPIDEGWNADRDTWVRLLTTLRTKQLVFQNAKFDLWMLLVGTRYWRGGNLSSALYWDTMLATRIIEPTEPSGLDATAKRLGLEGKAGLEDVVVWLRKLKFPSKRYDLAPWPLVERYVDGDAVQTLQVFESQIEYLENEADEEDAERESAEIERELALCKVLFAIEQRGLGYDVERSLEEAERLGVLADTLEMSMPFMCDISSAKRYFFDELGLTPAKLTSTGKPSLDEETVRDWAAEGVRWAKEYREVSRARRAVSMWYQGYPDKIGADGRLRCSYRQGTVASGRLSVERVQLQALPKADKIAEGQIGVRELLTAKEGYGLWSLDMQQAELRVATHYAGCVKMAEMMAAGVDVHGETTKTVIGVPADAPDYKLKRDIGKRLNFAAIFQVGGAKFQATLAQLADVHLPLGECEDIVHRWRQTYPEYGVAYRKAERAFEDRGYVRILPGTEFESRSYLGPRDWAHTGWNRMVQGSLAAWLRMWLVAVEDKWPDTLVLTVHDSIVLELPADIGDEIAEDVQRFSEKRASELFGVSMPVDVDRYV